MSNLQSVNAAGRNGQLAAARHFGRVPSTIRILCCLLLLPVMLRGAEKFSFERPLMGTRFAIVCYGGDEAAAKAAADEAFAAGEAINAVASDYLPGSELMRLPEQWGEPAALSPLLAELLDASFDIAEKTGGLFDPTLGPLTRLWRETRRDGKLPDPSLLAETRRRCGWQNAVLDRENGTLLLRKPGMGLDLGGIGKGFAADRMFAIMKGNGFPRTCIAAGGDLRLGDPPPGRQGWRVGLRTFDPRRPEEIVVLSNCAVSTSGDLHQFVEIDRRRYSHIIDPRTGLGLTERVAVSVIAPAGVLSDPLSTAACVAGAEKAEAFALERGATRVIVRRPGD